MVISKRVEFRSLLLFLLLKEYKTIYKSFKDHFSAISTPWKFTKQFFFKRHRYTWHLLHINLVFPRHPAFLQRWAFFVDVWNGPWSNLSLLTSPGTLAIHNPIRRKPCLISWSCTAYVEKYGKYVLWEPGVHKWRN